MLTLKKPITLLTCLFSFATAGNALAADKTTVESPVIKPGVQYKKFDFSADKRAAAKHIAGQYAQLKDLLASELDYDNLSLDITELSQSTLNLSAMKDFEAKVIAKKGFDVDTQSLVELRLADQSMLSLVQQGVKPLFAYEPEGDESHWQYIEAFDADGNTHLLDVFEMPARPILVLDINAKADLKQGLKLMRDIFSAAGKGKLAVPTETRTSSASAVLETTVLKQIRVNDDQEPWISGKAEMYGVVNGVDADRVEPELDVVDMPYLDYDDTNYYPNQIVIYWARYRWAAADMIIMEADGNTNYKDLALTLLDIASTILATIPDPTVQGYAIIPQLTSQLIKAMPDDWFTNDDDYVDVLYTILKNTTYTNHYGASGNAKVTLAPLNIQSQ